MKSVFIICTNKIYNNNSAASSRISNIARALALSGIRVFLCSVEQSQEIAISSVQEKEVNIFEVGRCKAARNIKDKIFFKLFYFFEVILYLNKIKNILGQYDSKPVIYIYPTLFISFEIACLFSLKFIGKYHIYREVNEVQKGTLYNVTYSSNPLRLFFELLYSSGNYLKYSLSEKLTRYYDGLLVISTNIEKYFKKYNANTLRIPILTDASCKRFEKAPSFVNSSPFLICFTGWIILKKEGFDIFFAALAKLKKRYPSFEFHMYGFIREREMILNTLPSRLGIKENVFYHGSVDHKSVLSEMRKYHLMVLPRPLSVQTKYGFSTKLSDYMTSGVPSLVTDVSDNGLFIRDGQNGFIIEAGSSDLMAEKLYDIISHYNENADKIASGAFDTAVAEFHYSNFAHAIDKFLS